MNTLRFDGPPLTINRRKTARLLQVSEATLRRWELAGFGPKPLRIARLVRYRMADLEEFLNSL